MKLYIGLWNVISLNHGYQIPDFFIPPGAKEARRDFLWNPPYLVNSMSRTRFDEIYQSTRLQNKELPINHRGKFWHVRKLIDEFNEQMTSTFGLS